MAAREPDPQDELRRRFDDIISGMDVSDLRQLAGQLLDFGRGTAAAPSRPSRRRPRRATPATYRIRVDLDDARPPIWRRLDIRSDLTLDAVHQALQAAFGWTDSHLHRFALGGGVFDRKAELFLCPFDVEEGEDDGLPASDVRLDETLAEPGDVLRYCYDYGDSWDLTLKLESVGDLADASAPPAVCVDGRRAAPPEDCGGLRDADQLAEVLEDPAHFDLAEVNQALTDPWMLLSDAGVDRRLLRLLLRLRGTAAGDDLAARLMSLTSRQDEPSPSERAAALEPALWFLDHVGDSGLTLTSAGYLKPDDVTAAAAVIPDAKEWIGKANRESQTFPVLLFRESLQRLKLLRKYRGRLLLTKAGAAARGKPEVLWRHCAERLPVGKDEDFAVQASLLALVYVASAPDQRIPTDSLAEALTYLDWREGGGHAPVSADSVAYVCQDTLNVMDNLTGNTRRERLGGGRNAMVAALARDVILRGHRA